MTKPRKERDVAWQVLPRSGLRCRPSGSASGYHQHRRHFASGQALESLIMHLQSDPLEEARATGQSLLEEARQVVPMFLERADKTRTRRRNDCLPRNTAAAVAKKALGICRKTWHHGRPACHSW